MKLQQNFKRVFSILLYTGYWMLGVLFDQSLVMIYLSLCNIVNVALAVIGRCPWSIREQTLTWRHGKLVASVCSTWRAVLKIFASLILIQQVNTSKSLQQELFTSWKKKNKSERSVFLATWKCFNCNKSSKQLSFRHELATVLKLFTRQLSSEQVRALEKGGQAVYRRANTKSSRRQEVKLVTRK